MAANKTMHTSRWGSGAKPRFEKVVVTHTCSHAPTSLLFEGIYYMKRPYLSTNNERSGDKL
jgi:hypothetical protein